MLSLKFTGELKGSSSRALENLKRLLLSQNDKKNVKHFFRVYFKQYRLSGSYYQTRVNTFSEFISNITGTLMELLPNNTTHFFRHQAILTFSESYWQIILHTFPEVISSNTDIFREFLPN